MAAAPAPKAAPHANPHAKAPQKTKIVARAKCKVAPADEYFGKLKMSILGIRNTIKDQGNKVDNDPGNAASTFNAIALTEDAIRDWEHKYPCDSWIPGSIFALEHFYTKVHTEDGVRHVHAAFAWLRHDFPRNRIVASAQREDGSATATSPVMATTTDAGPSTVNGGLAPSTAQQPQILPGGQAAPTPFPGTAPASVINAQQGSPRPH
ncbi:MAG TPA: hypothetical protein VHT53_02130 [Candidatus Elarobacter sp.]|jgi:hypothetical protein|nr:hypothetical protein [Candidatus Elarobacter sp.]